jgi:hypothetical protein
VTLINLILEADHDNHTFIKERQSELLSIKDYQLITKKNTDSTKVITRDQPSRSQMPRLHRYKVEKNV